MQLSFSRFLILFASVLFSLSATAQHFPVKVDPAILVPTVYLADYGSPQTMRVKVSLEDYVEDNFRIRLKMKMEADGGTVMLYTDQGIEMVLDGGETVYLTEYEQQMLVDQLTMKQGQLTESGVLPGGICKITFEAYDARTTSLLISNIAIDWAVSNLQLFQPPLLTLPANGNQIMESSPANIFFNWSPQSFMRIPGSIFEYKLIIAKLMPNVAPEMSIANPDFVIPGIPYNSYFFIETNFLPGEQYAWQVQAYEVINGDTLTARFSNQGYSDVFTFSIKEDCESIGTFDVPKQETDEVTNEPVMLLAWGTYAKHNEYEVRFRKFGSDSWTVMKTVQNELRVGTDVIEPGVDYEYSVRAMCNNWLPWEYAGTFSLGNDCNAPAPIIIDSNEGETIVLTWEASTGANSYKISYSYEGDDEGISAVENDATELTEYSLPAITSGKYMVQVDAVCADLTGLGKSTEVAFDAVGLVGGCPLPKPIGFSAWRADDSDDAAAAKFKWNSIEGVHTSYTVYYRKDGTEAVFSELTTTDPYGDAPNVEDDVLYEYYIQYSCGADHLVESEIGRFLIEGRAKTDPNIDPGTADCFPGLISAEARDETTGYFSWSKVKGAENYQLVYFVEGTEDYESFNTTATSTKQKNLKPGAKYVYRLRVRCDGKYSIYTEDGLLDLGNTTKIDGCDTLPFVGVESATTAEIQLAWAYEKKDDGQAKRSGYLIEYIEEGQDWSQMTSVDLNDIAQLKSENLNVTEDTVTYTITELKEQTTYYFRIKGKCGDDYAQSNEAVKGKTKGGDFAKGSCEAPGTCDRNPENDIDKLEKGDTIQVADYLMKLETVTLIGKNKDGKNIWKGTGISEAPFVGFNENIKVATTFDSLFVNDLSCVVDGKVKIDSAILYLLDEETRNKIKEYESKIDSIIDEVTDVLDKVDGALEDAENATRDLLTKAQGGEGVGMPITGGIGGYTSTQDLTGVSGTVSNGSVSYGGLTIPVADLPAMVTDKNKNVFSLGPDGQAMQVGQYVDGMDGLQDGPIDNSTYSFEFTEYSAQKYGFDKYIAEYGESAAMEFHYLKVGDDYCSAKAITEGDVDYVNFTGSGTGFDASKLSFVNRDGLSYNFSNSKLTLAGGPAKDAQEIMAVYIDGTDTTIIGALLLPSYEVRQRKVKIIPTEPQQVITAADITALQTSINATYNQAGVYFTVELDESIKSSWCGKPNCGIITPEHSALLSNDYTGDEAEVIEYYTSLDSFVLDTNCAYIFIAGNSLDASAENGLQGKMNFAMNYGFLYNVQTSLSDKHGRTLAHEIGHGKYNLIHIFDEIYLGNSTKGQSNIMSYSSLAADNKLNKLQWDVVYKPGFVWGILSKDDDQAKKDEKIELGPLTINFDSKPSKEKGEEKGTYVYTVEAAHFSLMFDDVAVGDYTADLTNAKVVYTKKKKSDEIIDATITWEDATGVDVADIGFIDAKLKKASIKYDKQKFSGNINFSFEQAVDKSISSFVKFKSGAKGDFEFEYTADTKNSLDGKFDFEGITDVAIDIVKGDAVLASIEKGTLSADGKLSFDIDVTNEVSFLENGYSVTLNSLDASAVYQIGSDDLSFTSISGSLSVADMSGASSAVDISLSKDYDNIVGSMSGTGDLSVYGFKIGLSSLEAKFNNKLEFIGINAENITASYKNTLADVGDISASLNIETISVENNELTAFTGSGNLSYPPYASIKLTNGSYNPNDKTIEFSAEVKSTVAGAEVDAAVQKVTVKSDGTIELGKIDMSMFAKYGPLTINFDSEIEIKSGGVESQTHATVLLDMSKGSISETVSFGANVKYKTGADGKINYLTVDNFDDALEAFEICGITSEFSNISFTYDNTTGLDQFSGSASMNASLSADKSFFEGFVVIRQGLSGSFDFAFNGSGSTFSADYDFGKLSNVDVNLMKGDAVIAAVQGKEFSNDGSLIADFSITSDVACTNRGFDMTLTDFNAKIDYNLVTNELQFNSLSGAGTIQNIPGLQTTLGLSFSKTDSGISASLSNTGDIAFYGMSFKANQIDVELDEKLDLTKLEAKDINVGYASVSDAVAAEKGQPSGEVDISLLTIEDNAITTFEGSGRLSFDGYVDITLDNASYSANDQSLSFSASMTVPEGAVSGTVSVNKVTIDKDGAITLDGIEAELVFDRGPLRVEFEKKPDEDTEGKSESINAKVILRVKEGEIGDNVTLVDAFVKYKSEPGKGVTFVEVQMKDQAIQFPDINGVASKVSAANFTYQKNDDGSEKYDGDVTLLVDLKDDKALVDDAVMLRAGLSGVIEVEYVQDGSDANASFSFGKLDNLNIDFRKDNKTLATMSGNFTDDGLIDGRFKVNDNVTFKTQGFKTSLLSFDVDGKYDLKTGEFSFLSGKGKAKVYDITGVDGEFAVTVDYGDVVEASITSNAVVKVYDMMLKNMNLSIQADRYWNITKISGKNISASINKTVPSIGTVTADMTIDEFTLEDNALTSLSGSGTLSCESYAEIVLTNGKYSSTDETISFAAEVNADAGGTKANVKVSKVTMLKNGDIELGEISADLYSKYGPVTLNFKSKINATDGIVATAKATVSVEVKKDKTDKTVSFEANVSYKADANGITYLSINETGKSVQFPDIYDVSCTVSGLSFTYEKTVSGESYSGTLTLDASLSQDKAFYDGFVVLRKGLDGTVGFAFDNSNNKQNVDFDFSGINNLKLDVVKESKVLASASGSITKEGLLNAKFTVNDGADIGFASNGFDMALNRFNADIDYNLVSGDVSINAISGKTTLKKIPGTNDASLSMGFSKDGDGIKATISNGTFNLYGMGINAANMTASLSEKLDLIKLEADGLVIEPNMKETGSDQTISGTIEINKLLIENGTLKTLAGSGHINHNTYGRIDITDASYKSETGILRFSAKVTSNSGPAQGELVVNEVTVNKDGDITIGKISMDMTFEEGPIKVEFSAKPEATNNAIQKLKATVSLKAKQGGKGGDITLVETDVAYMSDGTDISYLVVDVSKLALSFPEVYGVESDVSAVYFKYEKASDGTKKFKGSVTLDAKLSQDKVLYKDMVYMKKGLAGNIIVNYVQNGDDAQPSFDFSKITGLKLDFVKDKKVVASMTGSFNAAGEIDGRFKLNAASGGVEFKNAGFTLKMTEFDVAGKYKTNAVANEEQFTFLNGKAKASIYDIKGVDGEFVLNLDYGNELTATIGSNGSDIEVCKMKLSNLGLTATVDQYWDFKKIGGSFDLKHESFDAGVAVSNFAVENGELKSLSIANANLNYKGFDFKLNSLEYASSELKFTAELMVDKQSSVYVGVDDFTVKANGDITVGRIKGDIEKGILAFHFDATFHSDDDLDRFRGTASAKFGSKFSLAGTVDMGSAACGGLSKCSGAYSFGYYSLTLKGAVPIFPGIELTELGGEFGYNYECDFLKTGSVADKCSPRYGNYLAGLSIGCGTTGGGVNLTASAQVQFNEEETKIGLEADLKIPKDYPMIHANGKLQLTVPTYDLAGTLSVAANIPPKDMGVSKGWLFSMNTDVGFEIKDTKRKFEGNIDGKVLNALTFDGKFLNERTFNDQGVETSYNGLLDGNLSFKTGWGFSGDAWGVTYAGNFELLFMAKCSVAYENEDLIGARFGGVIASYGSLEADVWGYKIYPGYSLYANADIEKDMVNQDWVLSSSFELNLYESYGDVSDAIEEKMEQKINAWKNSSLNNSPSLPDGDLHFSETFEYTF